MQLDAWLVSTSVLRNTDFGRAWKDESGVIWTHVTHHSASCRLPPEPPGRQKLKYVWVMWDHHKNGDTTPVLVYEAATDYICFDEAAETGAGSVDVCWVSHQRRKSNRANIISMSLYAATTSTLYWCTPNKSIDLQTWLQSEESRKLAAEDVLLFPLW